MKGLFMLHPKSPEKSNHLVVKIASVALILFITLALTAPFSRAHDKTSPSNPADTTPDQTGYQVDQQLTQPQQLDNPDQQTHDVTAEKDEHQEYTASEKPEGYEIPPYWAVLPFVTLLLCIAILPLIKKTEHWWEHNRNRLFISLVLSVLVILYYWLVHPGVIDHETHKLASGFLAVNLMLDHAILAEYIPFIVLLFSLYVISGGIRLQGDLPAHPRTNTAFLAVGAGIASFIGTTGAAMVLIRPLLHTNSERKHVMHTVIFFIFLVCNIGGSLLPIGDPPLFLGYLRGVPFTWTFNLWPQWLVTVLTLLVIYYIWDTIAYRKEALPDLKRDETQVQKLRLRGKINFLWLLGVV
ncbi:sodium:proton antiporter, partial [Planctomycetota bacterium]